eukprot:CAMPEP_0184482518 /NCGR_PEP_ID=MMETSP0113_2-20130426/4082_1 /TAXON_ID=91329 /ORGANISM="Norrisiella sphaerica, Strain BC52" /LENGTH=775 /DNA_ID=CAMNT_0026862297 /DNA_START=248 /DNA_END=2575 /DNA_ORIENTATION=-
MAALSRTRLSPWLPNALNPLILALVAAFAVLTAALSFHYTGPQAILGGLLELFRTDGAFVEGHNLRIRRGTADLGASLPASSPPLIPQSSSRCVAAGVLEKLFLRGRHVRGSEARRGGGNEGYDPFGTNLSKSNRRRKLERSRQEQERLEAMDTTSAKKSPLKEGTCVRLTGLQKMAILNNATATVLGGPIPPANQPPPGYPRTGMQGGGRGKKGKGRVREQYISQLQQVPVESEIYLVELHKDGSRMKVRRANLRLHTLNVDKLLPFSGPKLRILNLDHSHPERCAQTFPPSIALNKLYLSNVTTESRYPQGEILGSPVPGTLPKIKEPVDLDALREAAEVQRQVRRYVQQFIRPGLSILEIAERIENTTQFLLGIKASSPKKLSVKEKPKDIAEKLAVTTAATAKLKLRSSQRVVAPTTNLNLTQKPVATLTERTNSVPAGNTNATTGAKVVAKKKSGGGSSGTKIPSLKLSLNSEPKAKKTSVKAMRTWTRLDRGYAYPTGLSLNNCAAHDSPNPGDPTKVLRYGDVLKVDFGAQIRGWIIDTAFTVAFDPCHDELLRAVRDATEMGIRTAGVGVTFKEIGTAIQGIMESRLANATLGRGAKHLSARVRCVRNLCGHNIKQYRIHGGKSVPTVSVNDDTAMELGEVYAIETFGSTGAGWVDEEGTSSHYMWNYDKGAPTLTELRKILKDNAGALKLMEHIRKNHGTLAFARRWLVREGFENHLPALEALVNAGAVNEYPPLCDEPGCYVAQFEHTIYLGPHGTEVLTRGEDY